MDRGLNVAIYDTSRVAKRSEERGARICVRFENGGIGVEFGGECR